MRCRRQRGSQHCFDLVQAHNHLSGGLIPEVSQERVVLSHTEFGRDLCNPTRALFPPPINSSVSGRHLFATATAAQSMSAGQDAGGDRLEDTAVANAQPRRLAASRFLLLRVHRGQPAKTHARQDRPGSARHVVVSSSPPYGALQGRVETSGRRPGAWLQWPFATSPNFQSDCLCLKLTRTNCRTIEHFMDRENHSFRLNPLEFANSRSRGHSPIGIGSGVSACIRSPLSYRTKRRANLIMSSGALPRPQCPSRLSLS